MPSVSSSSRPKVLLSSTVMTPSLPTLSMASAMSSPIWLSAAEMDAVAAICSLVSTSLAWLSSSAATASTAFSMPRLRAIGLAPAATLRRPSLTRAWARTVAVVVPSPATSSVFLATSLTSSAPIFSYGSSSSISLAIETPSFVIVGAPHFFSSTTLRPRGPKVTRTASARMFRPRSRPRRASSSKAMIFAISVCRPSRTWNQTGRAHADRRVTAAGLLALTTRECQRLFWHSACASASCAEGAAGGIRRAQPDAASAAKTMYRPAQRAVCREISGDYARGPGGTLSGSRRWLVVVADDDRDGGPRIAIGELDRSDPEQYDHAASDAFVVAGAVVDRRRLLGADRRVVARGIRPARRLDGVACLVLLAVGLRAV